MSIADVTEVVPTEEVPEEIPLSANEGDRTRRKNTLNQKGKQFKLATLGKFMKTVYKRLQRQISLLGPLLESTSVDLVNTEITNLDRIYTELTDTHARLGAIFDEVEDRESDEYEECTSLAVLMDQADSIYFALKEKVCTWQLQREKEAQTQNAEKAASVRSFGSGGSRSSKRSRPRSTASKRTWVGSMASDCSNLSVKRRARIAGLKAEAEALKERKEAELAAELLRIEQKIKRAEAIDRVYTESAHGKVFNPYVQKVEVTEKVNDKPPHGEVAKHCVHPAKKVSCIPDPGSSVLDLQVAVMEMMKLQCAPKPELDTFSGDPLEYLYFKATFQDVVEATVPDQRGRLTRLIKYTAGDAKELVKHLVHADPSSCYDKALSLLDKEYGNFHLISCSYIKELRQWKPVKQHDSASYKKLYRFLLKCQTYKSDGRLQELDSTDMIRTVISKVHRTHQERWNRRAIDIRQKYGKEADFSDLVKFMEREAQLLSDPAYSQDALSDADLVKNYSTHTQRVEVSQDLVSCPLCRAAHDIEDCKDYLSKTIDERHRTVFREKLCFGCLGPVTDDHRGKSCNNKRKCRVCNGGHPTTLHDGKGNSSANHNANHTTLENDVISMCVVPVQLWHKDNREKCITVYALLDDCSQATFIRDDVLESLAIPDQRHTSIRVTTLNGEQEDQAVVVEGLSVECVSSHSAWYSKSEVGLPCVYSRPALAIDTDEIPTPSKISSWEHLQALVNKLPDYDPAIPIGLMIGANCPIALEPLEVIQSTANGPYAKRSRLGWCIVGPIKRGGNSDVIYSNCTRTIVPVKDVTTGSIMNHYFATENTFQDTFVTKMLEDMYTTDFNEVASEKRALSFEDEKFLEIMEEGVCKRVGHYELPLPLRKRIEELQLPNNRRQVLDRLASLRRKLLKDESLHGEYVAAMESLISKGYARRADMSKDQKGQVWYVPHFGVYNSQKGKLRVVLDFSVQFKGRCLNEELIQGPDMTNLLVGVLVRFRKEPVAVMADLVAMFHQVFTPESQCSLLRFVYWPDGNLDAEPKDFEMCVHPFGAVSSGSCANFALRKTAHDAEAQFGEEAAKSLRRDFYVDDLLKSFENVSKAKQLIQEIRGMCATGGFNLTKVVSNSREVISSMPSECLSPSLVDLDIAKSLPIERALGVHWCVESDTLQFRIVMQDKPLTKRGVLSTMGSIYDPIGQAGPFLLKGRKILQQINSEGTAWDDGLSPELRSAWEQWRNDLPNLQDLKINRCYKPKDFKTVACSFHSFSDASDYGYGQATYLRQVNREGEVCVSLVMGKSRVVPSKQTTIPRLELTAALVSAKVTAMLKEELDITNPTETYWVDSMIVLGYIQNDVRRFRTFVANRTRKIRDLTEKNLWKYVSTDNNPADDASRGLSVNDEKKVTRWFDGPSFLWLRDDPSRLLSVQATLADDDPEIQFQIKSNVSEVKVDDYDHILCTLGTRISSWMRQKRVLAWVLIFIDKCRKKREDTSLTTADVKDAENSIIKMVQHKHFGKDIAVLKAGGKRLVSSQLVRLDPFLDDGGILKVGGRLKKSAFEEYLKHPIILPKKDIIVRGLIEWYHRKVEHLGRTTTLNELRSQGFWVINASSQVRSVIFRCVRCKLFRGRLGTQKMADLPESRVVDEPPFSYCGVDMFGPFLVKEGRSEVKRYGIIFTCFCCRAVHLKTTIKMNTDSFLLALRRFIGRRGPVRSIKSDNGGNFVGAENELQKARREIDSDKIRDFLLYNDCDWIEWERNSPESSHMGGVWERQIRSVRNVLSSLLKDHAGRLNDECLRTLFVEVEAIVNSRPLTIESLTDKDVKPLCPNQLLTMKSKVVLPPPGVFQKADVYCRKRWRAVQYLSNEFWERWRKEYLVIMQERQKWNSVTRNFKVNDVVLVKDQDAARNQWPMGRITKVFPSDDGLVRKVNVKVCESKLPLLRPVTKLVLLVEGDAKE